MRHISVCPSLLTDGCKDYSPKAVKTLFAGTKTTCRMELVFDENEVPVDNVLLSAENLSIERTGHLCRLDFERFGIHIGISEGRVCKILDGFMEFSPLVDELIARSFFHEDRVRRTYKRIIEERRRRFIRESE